MANRNNNVLYFILNFAIIDIIATDDIQYIDDYSHPEERVFAKSPHRVSPEKKEIIINRNAQYLKNTSLPEERIVGGRHERDMPVEYTVIFVRTTYRAKYFGAKSFCGGFMITADVVLTAAHCIDYGKYDFPNSAIRAIIGNRYRLNRTQDTQYRKVKGVLVHELFERGILGNNHDVALVKLTKPIDTRRKFAIAKLSGKPHKAGMICFAIGCGRMYQNGPRSNEILVAEVIVITTEECDRIRKVSNINTFCVVSNDAYHSGVCQGDSGSGLLCDGKMYGVAMSTDKRCEKYSVYTTVYSHLQWIKKNKNMKAAKTKTIQCGNHLHNVFILLIWIRVLLCNILKIFL
uniref:Peptidase S1 domain-containing protein n=1 Tax=Glossina brevipalpis TaxID=37001 RepID=A0A1A9WF78_9MUSC